jgi:hypothetical protein
MTECTQARYNCLIPQAGWSDPERRVNMFRADRLQSELTMQRLQLRIAELLLVLGQVRSHAVAPPTHAYKGSTMVSEH